MSFTRAAEHCAATATDRSQCSRSAQQNAPDSVTRSWPLRVSMRTGNCSLITSNATSVISSGQRVISTEASRGSTAARIRRPRKQIAATYVRRSAAAVIADCCEPSVPAASGRLRARPHLLGRVRRRELGGGGGCDRRALRGQRRGTDGGGDRRSGHQGGDHGNEQSQEATSHGGREPLTGAPTLG